MQSPSLLTTLLILLIGLGAARLMAGKLSRLAVPAIVVELLIGFGLGNSLLSYKAIAPSAASQNWGSWPCSSRWVSKCGATC